MTIQILLDSKIRSEILKILAGMSFKERDRLHPRLHILSPWISDVEIKFSDFSSLSEMQNLFLVGDYGIESINLPYALLLAKLHRGAEVNVVVGPPTEKHYFDSPQYSSRMRVLYDFLDEIGCNVFVNPNLHTKLILANDLALLGSFNLTKSALYDRDEIGVSINDLDNLRVLQKYSWDVIRRSQPYGYTGLLNLAWLYSEETDELLIQRIEKRWDNITRGWLFDHMMENLYPVWFEDKADEQYGEFFNVTAREDRDIRSYSSNLSLFYIMNFRKLLSSEVSRSIEYMKFFSYTGEDSVDSFLSFLNGRFVRESVPSIKLRIRPF